MPRSCLSVPGSSAKMLAKAPGLPADEIVLDLEDAVAPTMKDAARASVAAALSTEGWGAKTISVRINAPRTPWCHQDVLAVATSVSRVDSLVVPKVESAGDLAFAERLLDGIEAAAGRRRPVRLQALIETASGLSRIQEIAAATPRLDALIIGYADLASSLGRTPDGARDLGGWRWAQEHLLLAARTHGLLAIAGPPLGGAVDADFDAAVQLARAIGFDGKWAIHPDQLPALDEAFEPTEEELSWAHRVVVALTDAERSAGAGAVSLDGQMLDEAVRSAALRTLARAGGSR